MNKIKHLTEEEIYSNFLNSLNKYQFLDHIAFQNFCQIGQSKNANILYCFYQFQDILFTFLDKQSIDYLDEAVELMQDYLKTHHTSTIHCEHEIYPVLIGRILFNKLNENNKQEHQVVKANKI